MESNTGTLTRNLSVPQIGGGKEVIVPRGTLVTVHGDQGGMYVSGKHVGATVYVEESAVEMLTPFEAKQNEIIAVEIKRFQENADKALARMTAILIERIETEGALSALKWKGADLLAAEMEANLAEALTRWVEEGQSAMQAVERGRDYLQSQVNEGLRAGWSGVITNEVYKARGIAALDLLGHGTFSHFATGAKYQTILELVKIEPVRAAREALRLLVEKEARAKSAQSIAKIQAEIEQAEETLRYATLGYAAEAQEVGAPDDLIEEMTAARKGR